MTVADVVERLRTEVDQTGAAEGKRTPRPTCHRGTTGREAPVHRDFDAGRPALPLPRGQAQAGGLRPTFTIRPTIALVNGRREAAAIPPTNPRAARSHTMGLRKCSAGIRPRQAMSASLDFSGQ